MGAPGQLSEPLEFPMLPARECPFDPTAAARLRQELPVSQVRIWDGSFAWLVTRFDDVRAVLATPG
jgi:hypothetical protein